MSTAPAKARRPGIIEANKRSARWVLRLGGLSPSALLKRTLADTRCDDVMGRAAQLSFYFMLALFPLISFACSVAAFAVSDDQQFSRRLLQSLRPTMPDAAFTLMKSAIAQVLQNPSHARLGVSLLLTVWSASYGVEALIDGVNVAFDVREHRSWWKRRLLALGLTIVLEALVLLAFSTIFWGTRIADLLAGRSGTQGLLVSLWPAVQWGFLILCLSGAIALVYRLAPNLRTQSLVAVLPGTLLAVVGWILAALAFRFYIDVFFTSYTNTYGSLAAAIALLLWLYLTAAILLLRAELNSEIRWAASDSGSGDAQEALKENRSR
jgi:membrane protein